MNIFKLFLTFRLPVLQAYGCMPYSYLYICRDMPGAGIRWTNYAGSHALNALASKQPHEHREETYRAVTDRRKHCGSLSFHVPNMKTTFSQRIPENESDRHVGPVSFAQF